MNKLMPLSDEVKFSMERYSDIVKLRAAQVLALFIAYAFSLRGSEEFMDGPSLLAMSIPIAAWVFDLIARGQYMCPYAYAAAAYAFQESKAKDGKDAVNSVPNLVLDFTVGERSEAFKIFSENDDEMARRRLFRTWFTWKDQRVAGAIFVVFFFIALVATGAFEQKEIEAVQPDNATTTEATDG